MLAYPGNFRFIPIVRFIIGMLPVVHQFMKNKYCAGKPYRLAIA
jgi:hypothetical protein